MNSLPPALFQLVNACELECVRGCCGAAAFSFDPIHIASYLIRFRGSVDESMVQDIRIALAEWKAACGLESSARTGYRSSEKEFNQNLTSEQVDELSKRIEHNLDAAKELISRSQKLKYLTEEEKEEQREEQEAAAFYESRGISTEQFIESLRQEIFGPGKMKIEQADPANRHPSGTSGMSPADPASRAGATPEASGDS